MVYRIWETNYYLWVGDFAGPPEGPRLEDLQRFCARLPYAPPITGIVKREYDLCEQQTELPVATLVEWEVLTTDRRVCAVIGRL